MGVNTTGLLNTQTEVYASYKNDAVTKNETAAKKDSTAKTEEKNESGVVYDKSDSSKDNKKATYSINKMSAEDRAALVQHRLGYYDQFHFSKAFNKEMEITPKEYRRRYK